MVISPLPDENRNALEALVRDIVGAGRTTPPGMLANNAYYASQSKTPPIEQGPQDLLSAMRVMGAVVDPKLVLAGSAIAGGGRAIKNKQEYQMPTEGVLGAMINGGRDSALLGLALKVAQLINTPNLRSTGREKTGGLPQYKDKSLLDSILGR